MGSGSVISPAACRSVTSSNPVGLGGAGQGADPVRRRDLERLLDDPHGREVALGQLRQPERGLQAGGLAAGEPGLLEALHHLRGYHPVLAEQGRELLLLVAGVDAHVDQCRLDEARRRPVSQGGRRRQAAEGGHPPGNPVAQVRRDLGEVEGTGQRLLHRRGVESRRRRHQRRQLVAQAMGGGDRHRAAAEDREPELRRQTLARHPVGQSEPGQQVGREPGLASQEAEVLVLRVLIEPGQPDVGEQRVQGHAQGLEQAGQVPRPGRDCDVQVGLLRRVEQHLGDGQLPAIRAEDAHNQVGVLLLGTGEPVPVVRDLVPAAGVGLALTERLLPPEIPIERTHRGTDQRPSVRVPDPSPHDQRHRRVWDRTGRFPCEGSARRSNPASRIEHCSGRIIDFAGGVQPMAGLAVAKRVSSRGAEEPALRLLGRHRKAARPQRLMQAGNFLANRANVEFFGRHRDLLWTLYRSRSVSVVWRLEVKQHEGAGIACHELNPLDHAEEVLSAFHADKHRRRLTAHMKTCRVASEGDQQALGLRQRDDLHEASFDQRLDALGRRDQALVARRHESIGVRPDGQEQRELRCLRFRGKQCDAIGHGRESRFAPGHTLPPALWRYDRDGPADLVWVVVVGVAPLRFSEKAPSRQRQVRDHIGREFAVASLEEHDVFGEPDRLGSHPCERLAGLELRLPGHLRGRQREFEVDLDEWLGLPFPDAEELPGFAPPWGTLRKLDDVVRDLRRIAVQHRRGKHLLCGADL